MSLDYFVYILECSDKSYYTGITNDLDRRISEHNIGIDPTSYTYNKKPVKLVFSEFFKDVNEAIEREKQIKGWFRKKKKALIEKNWNMLVEYSKSNSNTKVKNGSTSSP